MKLNATLKYRIAAIYIKYIQPLIPFEGSANYWEKRYKSGKNSGAGSYNKLSEFKADVINAIVRDNQVKTVIEFGCGDGNQLSLAKYPTYTGFDISETAIKICEQKFSGDNTKKFRLLEDFSDQRAELVMSLDVIYHLIEDDTFHKYMENLFKSATKLVLIYSSNTSTQRTIQSNHVKHREFSAWIESHQPEWELKSVTENKYPHKDNDPNSSFADFYLFARKY